MLQTLATYYNDTYNSYPYDQTQLSPESAGALVAVMMLFLIPALIIAVFTLIGMWRVFKKASKPGWAVLAQTTAGPAAVPRHRMAKARTKSTGWQAAYYWRQRAWLCGCCPSLCRR